MDEAYQETIDRLSDTLAEAQDRVKYLEEQLAGVTSNLEFEYKDGLRNTKIRADLTERLQACSKLIEQMRDALRNISDHTCQSMEDAGSMAEMAEATLSAVEGATK